MIFPSNLVVAALDYYGIFNFPSNKSGDTKPGGTEENASWNGIVGLLSRGEADIGLTQIAVTKERLEVVDFSEPYYLIERTYAMNFPSLVKRAYIYTYPFDIKIWIGIIISLFLVPAVFCILGCRKPPYMYIFFKLIGAMFKQSFTEYKFNNRFLIGIWWCFCFILSVSCAAVVASLMVIPMYEHFQKNFEELAEFVKKGEYKLIMPKGTAYTKDALNSLKGSHVFIAEAVVRNDWFVTIEDYNNPYIPSKTAVLGSRLAFYFKYGKAPFSTKYISEDTLKFVRNSVMVNKRFCCKKQIDCVIKKRLINLVYSKGLLTMRFAGVELKLVRILNVSNEDFLQTTLQVLLFASSLDTVYQSLHFLQK
ncbi:uncharacterized protein CDAR_241771 [Caerostris darwini]|uniref:Ionotropic glutamate receptor L-glutamate and glycine-binding domain-containing protein n=1 Tax=Caerostris darwini TaxID=1538125 RepID=A0AAV4NQA0_9ARAC|nr:uncharacterized protein CDAR_241771 [Caerostris darwini]